MDSRIQEFMQFKRLAIAGVSHSEQKMGTGIYKELKARGFEVFGVNPTLDQIDADRCYHNISELSGQVDGVVICVPSRQAAIVLREAVAAGINKVWIQQGAQSVETSRVARELGVDPVEGKCILMYAGEVKSIHAFHRFFAKLFGTY